MSDKKIVLFSTLGLLSVAAGGSLGLLDIFGFVDGRHELSFTFLAISVLVVYFSLITLFILDFVENPRTAGPFLLSSILFGVTFFLMNLSLVLSVFATILYFGFLTYAYHASLSRAKNQIKFAPQDIFMPILQKSFLYLLITLSAIAFAQSKELIANQNLIQPSMVRFASRLPVLMVNNSLNSRLQSQLQSLPPDLRQQQSDEDITRLVLNQTLENMADPETNKIYGIDKKDIPIESIEVQPNGIINIEPMIEQMLPIIAGRLNEAVREYAYITPLVVAFVVFLLLQPIMWVVSIIESALTLLIFKILITAGFLKVSQEQRSVQKLHL